MLRRRRQIDAAAIDIGFVAGKPIRLRTDHAAVNDALVEVGASRENSAVPELPFLEESKHGDFVSLKGRLKAVDEANAITMIFVRRCANDNADRAARMQHQSAGAEDIDKRDNLGAEREDQI